MEKPEGQTYVQVKEFRNISCLEVLHKFPLQISYPNKSILIQVLFISFCQSDFHCLFLLEKSPNIIQVTEHIHGNNNNKFDRDYS